MADPRIARTSFPRNAACAFAACAAMLAWTTHAAGDLVPSLSLQTGVTYTRSPGANTDDYFVAATPQLVYFLESERSLYSLTYSFTGSLDSDLPNGIANRLAYASLHDVTPRTRLLFGAEALQALIGNYLLVRGASETQVGASPPLNTSLLTIGVSQGITHEISPNVTLNQGVTGTLVKSLDPDVEIRNYLATGTLTIDRAWTFDALGAELDINYARTFFPPAPESQFVTVAIGPTYSHDISTKLNLQLAALAQVAFDPDGRGKTRVGPAGRATLAYFSEGSGITLEGVAGIEPNLLLGTLLQSEQVTIRGVTPLSDRYNVLFGVSSGYLHAKAVDLNGTGVFDNEFDAVLHDADLTWAATDWMSVFLRYQFIGQSKGTGAGATPALVRHGAILGLDFFAARPVPKTRLPNGKFGSRVDGADSQQLGKPAAGSSLGTSGTGGGAGGLGSGGTPGGSSGIGGGSLRR